MQETKEEKKGIVIGIRGKLIAEVFVLLLIVCMVLTTFSYSKSAVIIQKDVQESLQNRAIENAAIYAGWLKQWRAEIETLGRREAIVSMDWEEQEPVAVAEAERLGYKRIQISDMTGDTHVPGQDVFNLAERSNFIAGSGGETTITIPVPSEADQTMIMVATAPIIDTEGEIKGVIGGVITAEEFNNIVQEIDMGEGGYAYMLDSTGTRIADKDLAVVEEGRNDHETYQDQKGYESYVAVQQAMMNQETGVSQYSFEGTDYLCAYAPIEGTTWSLALAYPERSATKDVKALRSYMYLLMLVFLGIGAIVSCLISNNIRRPLSKIEAYAKEMNSDRPVRH